MSDGPVCPHCNLPLTPGESECLLCDTRGPTVVPRRGKGDLPLPYLYPRFEIPFYDYAWRPYDHADTFWHDLVNPTLRKLSRPLNVLDVGGGNGIMAKGYWDSIGANVTVLDIWDGYEHKVPNLVLGDAALADQIFGAGSFDIVQCTELLEHNTKTKGEDIVGVLEDVARHLVIFTTPCGYDHQPVEAQGNPHQVHLCGWDPEEFLVLDYKVLINGPERAKTLKNEGWYDTPQLIAWKEIS